MSASCLITIWGLLRRLRRLEKEQGPSCGDVFWLFPCQSSGFCFFYIALFLYTARILTSTHKCSSLLYSLTVQHVGGNLTKLRGCLGAFMRYPGWSGRAGAEIGYLLHNAQLAAGSADLLSRAALKRSLLCPLRVLCVYVTCSVMSDSLSRHGL